MAATRVRYKAPQDSIFGSTHNYNIYRRVYSKQTDEGVT